MSFKRKKFKSILSFLLTFFMGSTIITMPTYSVEASEIFRSNKLNRLIADEPEKLLQPISDKIQVGAISITQNEAGEVIAYAATTGNPALFYVYNVDQRKVLAKHNLVHYNEDGTEILGKICDAVDLGPDGKVNIVARSYGLFFRYDPETDELKSYGRFYANINGSPKEQTSVMAKGVFDEAGNYYFGTYPDAALFKYDIAQDKLIELGNRMVIGSYIRSIASYKNLLFMGGMGVKDIVELGKTTANAILYDTTTNEVIEIPNPSLAGVFDENDVQNYYASSTSGRWVFTRSKIGSVNKYYLNVFDMETRQWVDYIPGTLHLHVTPMVDTNADNVPDTLYFHDYKNPGALLYKYDPVNHVRELVSDDVYAGLSYLVNPQVLKLNDQAKYPGYTIVAGATDKGIVLINLSNHTIEFIGNVLPQGATQLRGLQASNGSEILISSYMGSEAYVYDFTKNQVTAKYPSLQIEGMNYIDGKFYCGMYGRGAALQVIDITKPAQTGVNPKQLATLAENAQDRAFVVEDAGENILWGSVPNYGMLGGAFGIYNKKDGTAKVYQHVVPDQSIGGLAYKDGKIYGSTHIYGGLGITPKDDYAKMFIFDMATEKVEKVVDIKLSTDTNKQYFAGKMQWAPNGDLLVATAKTLLIVNPEDLSIKKEIPIGNTTLSVSRTLYVPYSLLFGEDGLLYTNIGGHFSAVDIETYEVKELSGSASQYMTLASDGNIYYAAPDNTTLMRLSLDTLPEYKVNFDVYNGHIAETQTVVEGLTAAVPESIALEEHILAGWYLDKDFNTAYDFSTPVSGDLTLYAKWYCVPEGFFNLPKDQQEYIVSKWQESGKPIHKPNCPISGNQNN